MRFVVPVRVGAAGRRGTSLVVAACLALLAGCGMSGGGSSGGGPTPSGAPSPSPSPSPSPAPRPRLGPAENRTGVVYATTSPRQTLDLYLPAGDGSTAYPMVVLIHGGGFASGDSSQMDDLAELLSTKGFAAASLNYRLSGEAPFPAGVQDVAAAVRYLRAHAPSWGVDPQRIGAWGESAGGYLASMLGAAGDDARFRDAALGNPGVSGRVQAVVSWFGPADFSTMDEQARAAGCANDTPSHLAAGSPESLWLGAPLEEVPGRVEEASVVRAVREAPSLPPYRLVHGDRDCTVAPGQSEQLMAALDARGAGATLVIVEDADHADHKIAEAEVRNSIEFLRSSLGTRRAG